MEHAPEILAALAALIELVENLGLPGLIVMIMLGPVLTVLAVFALAYLWQRHARADEEVRRLEAKADRELIRELVERHRAEMDKKFSEFTDRHATVVKFYEDNVQLVKETQQIAKDTQRLTADLRDIVVNNTRAVDHLASVAQNNLFCPLAREAATGKK